MTIFFTIDDISKYGGAERVVANLANAFSPQNHIVIIAYHLHGKIPFPLPKNTQIINLEDIYGDFEPKGTIGKLKLCHYINKIIRENGGKSNALIANCNVFYPFFKRRDTKYIRLEHNRFAFLHRKYMDKKPLFPRVKFFDVLVILSQNELAMWQKLHNNIKVIPNFLPQMPQHRANLNSRIILSAGRMDEGDQKGFLRLLDIWKIVQDSQDSRQNWQLVIVGDGALKGEIEAKIHALNLGESVALKPFTQNIAREYLSASIYAMASHFEGFPMALIEASSFALPCVAFDVKTGPSDIIAHEKSGVLVEDGDLQGFANALIRLMRDESMREEFGKNAREIVGEKFSKESVLQKWVDLFESK